MPQTNEKKEIKNPVLKTWDALNDYLRTCKQPAAEKLLKEELEGRARKMFVLRIHSRLNKLRAMAERAKFGVGEKR